mmetsp:Transcript_13788/g.50210  ORF Transcript_13788/g.50210 Transcript_13788/m.50210 type:complete len:561 (+) Transcript_13788:81-1763(+)
MLPALRSKAIATYAVAIVCVAATADAARPADTGSHAGHVQGSRPHILMILTDDYGWANAGWHRPEGYEEVQTPYMDALVKQGVELDRHYAYKFCSPTRSALQSGRNPIHVNVQNLDPYNHNPDDPVGGFSAIPRNMTGIAAKMASAGYATAMAGKWDAGMATPDHTPKGRGYESSLIYFHHQNDYWDMEAGNAACKLENITRPRDLWKSDADSEGVASDMANPLSECADSGLYSTNPDCVFEEYMFRDHLLDVIDHHDPDTPLFMFWAPHSVHSPLEVPKQYWDRFDFIDTPARRDYHALVTFMDEMIGNVTNALRDKGMWANTLVVFSSDNGGPIYYNGTGGANNFPLRGGKASNFEGGVRVNAWASGGVIPRSKVGSKLEGLITIWDWYATFCALAGVDPTDTRAAQAGLPPIDSIDMSGYLLGESNTSPRTQVELGSVEPLDKPQDLYGTKVPADVIVQGIIVDEGDQGLWKLVLGQLSMNGWTGPQWPNATTDWAAQNSWAECGVDTGCLFELRADPTEHNDLADSFPEQVWGCEAAYYACRRFFLTSLIATISAR